MLRRPASRPSSPAMPSTLGDRILRHVLGGMPGGGQPIVFPPYPPIRQTSFRFPIPPAPNPFHFAVATSGGTGRTPQHAIHAGFDNGKAFGNVTVHSPAVSPFPGVPLLNGGFIPPVQTHTMTLGVRIRP